ncbi:MAG: sulfhydrogenase subunit gamma (sulfur reductase) [Halobacteriales archaeon]|jgi:sulfhydrogenase subunit gamma (sulfur reductase)
MTNLGGYGGSGQVPMQQRLAMEPEPATITDIRRYTDKDALFEIDLEERDELGHGPGEFVQVFVPGIGEAPISVSSAPEEGTTFDLVIREVGNVTGAIHEMEPGDQLGIRGPYGKGWEPERLKGQDLLFVAGGIGLPPTRSMIEKALANREDYGDITILYGTTSPNDILHAEDIERWREREDVEFRMTVDDVPDGTEWDGNVGVITTIIPPVDIDPETTTAMICGPPVMYQYVLEELEKKNLPEENILVSLERRMRCAVGLCGHCQMNDLYVCKDGPVFKYTTAKERGEAI